MDLKRRFFFICLALAGLSLASSFYLNRQLPLALAVLFPVAGMLLARRPSLEWLAYFSLAGFAALSASGILLGIPLMVMAISSSAALASWDLILESRPVAPEGSIPPTGLYVKLHLKSLGAAVGLGLLGVIAGQWVHWQVPFLGMIVLVILALFSMDRLMEYLKRLSSSD